MIAWDALAKSLKFNSAKEMFEKLYEKDGTSLEDLARRFAVANHTMRAALVTNGIVIRSRGGVTSQRVHLTTVALDEIKKEGVLNYANTHGINPSAVYKALKKAGYDSRGNPAKPSPEPEQTVPVAQPGEPDHDRNQ